MNNLSGWMPVIWSIAGLLLLLVAVIWGLFALGAVYSVWSAHKEGQADLAQAHNEQLIQVAQAKGRLEAAQLNKQAEIIDAEAVAKSVEIIGTALHDNQGYLQWKWIHMMEQRDSGDTIYVPTEAYPFWRPVNVARNQCPKTTRANNQSAKPAQWLDARERPGGNPCIVNNL